MKILFFKNLILLVFFVCFKGNAQMGVQKSKVEDILLFKEKPLLVVLAKEGGELEKNNFNTYFKEAVNNIWKISPSIEFVSPDTYIDLRDNEDSNKKYAYLDFIVMGITGNAPGNSFIVGHTDKRVSPHYTTMYTENNKYTYADLFFHLTILHNDLNDAVAMDKQALKKRRNTLFKQIPLEVVSKKTLLLDEALITKALKEEINNLYDYDYKIVSKEEIDEAITNRQGNTFVMKKVVSAPRPLRRSSAGGVIDGSRHDNGMLKTYQDNITGTALNAIYFNSFFDTETGKILFFGRPSFKDKKIDVKDFKTIKKAIK